MEKFQFSLSKIDKFIKLPYYYNRFNALVGLMQERWTDYTKNGCTIYKYVEWEVIVAGIKYYYETIDKENLKRENKVILCRKLVEAMNKAVYILSDEGVTGDKKIDDYLTAYKEYLQEIGNTFRKESEREGRSVSRLFLTFSLDLLNDKARIDSLFSSLYGSPVFNPVDKLCAVFVPSDSDVENVFKYLPMLTHEISHNFKYSNTFDRNSFVVNYMLDCICDKIIRQLFIQVSKNNHNMFLGKYVKELALQLKNVLKDELLSLSPDFMQHGHLDQLSSLICKVLFSPFERDSDVNEFYYQGVVPYDILKETFMQLVSLSDMRWYLPDKSKYAGKDDKEIIASFVLDLFTEDDYAKMQKLYANIDMKNKEYKMFLNNNISNNEKGITSDLLEIAADVLFISVIEKIKRDFGDFGKKRICKEVLIALVDDSVVFEKNIDLLIEQTKEDDEQDMLDFVDRCVTARGYLENIYFLCELYKKKIINQHIHHPLIVRIFEALNNALVVALKDKRKKPYFSARNIHSIFIQMGLLDTNPNRFEFYYSQIFSGWDVVKVRKMVFEFLHIYREIFADLSMCAVFQFNQIGYFRYMTEQFQSVREVETRLPRNMAWDRIQIVLRTLETQYKKEDIIEIFNRDKDRVINWTEDWNEIFTTYLYKDTQDDFDKRYILVYSEKILPSEWIKSLQNNEVIQEIGVYYNSVAENIEKEEISKKFLKTYLQISKKKVEYYKKTSDDPMTIVLGEVQNDYA